MSQLFTSLKVRDLTFRNRIFVSPMCQYSAKDGVPGDWHLVHLGSRAVGGAGLVIAEATAVCGEGRISPADTGLWNESQAAAFARISDFVKQHGAAFGVQLAHAGRKASTQAPWDGGKAVGQGGWTPLAPSDERFSPEYPQPRAMTLPEIRAVVEQFAQAARYAERAGVQVIEIHMAHGYLMHEFLSPLTNRRQDQYGGSFENRIRLPLEVARAIRGVWPSTLPVFVRISATDWVEGGWDLPQSIAFCRQLRELGVDLIDCSSGGLVANAKIPVQPGYQVEFAAQVRRQAEIATGAVGLITDASQAEAILQSGQADAILLARSLLDDPYWPLHAAKALKQRGPWPKQYMAVAPRD